MTARSRTGRGASCRSRRPPRRPPNDLRPTLRQPLCRGRRPRPRPAGGLCLDRPGFGRVRRLRQCGQRSGRRRGARPGGEEQLFPELPWGRRALVGLDRLGDRRRDRGRRGLGSPGRTVRDADRDGSPSQQAHAPGDGDSGRHDHGTRRRPGARSEERPGPVGRRPAQRRQLGLHVRRVHRRLCGRPLVPEAVAMSFTQSLPVAFAIGAAFGFTLEKAGLGDAKKLAGQFYLKDFTVLKVMFSAIVTAMLGAFWLSRLGVIDLAALYVPETFLAPQIVGGLIFGGGFVLAGLCPGTSCVAAASGRGDGLATVGGLLAGVLLTGLAMPLIGGFYASTAYGAFTLPQLTGAPYGAVVAAIVLIALAVFAGVERLERRV